MGLKEPNSKLILWCLKLNEFDYEIVYKKGVQNSNADALSRIRPDINNHETFSTIGTNGSTIHSAEEIQPESNVTVEIPFKNKLKRIVKSPVYDEDSIINIFTKFIKPNRLVAIYTDDGIFRIIQRVFSAYFANNKTYRLIRCTLRTRDFTDNDEQDEIIRKYHYNNNHRGIEETYLHLKRECFFPHMRNKISQIINECDTCQTVKYDRHPQKLIFQTPETPENPLDILHIDIYHINHQQILTIIDKFSKFATGFTIAAKT